MGFHGNVLLMMIDAQGRGVSGACGGFIPHSALDRNAKAGMRYTRQKQTR